MVYEHFSPLKKIHATSYDVVLYRHCELGTEMIIVCRLMQELLIYNINSYTFFFTDVRRYFGSFKEKTVDSWKKGKKHC